MGRLVRFLREYLGFSVALVAAVVSLILQLVGYRTAAYWILGVVAIIETFPLIKGMWDDLRSGTYGIDILALTAIVTSVLLKEYWAGMVIVLMLTGGEALEDYAEHRAKTELDALLTRAPQLAHVLRSRDKIVDIAASEVKTGDRVLIKPGELVPVDGTILEGSASFDESSLTGESLPQAKDPGEQVLSGSVNLDSVVTIKAIHSAADSQYQQIVKLVQTAAHSQAPFVRLADRYAVPFTLIAFAIAGGAWAVSGQAIRFLEVIVVATPCPLILAAPIAIISGMSRASKNGIIIKTGSALERLAGAQTVAFDKTGTLTLGAPKVSQVSVFHDFSATDVLAAAASLEQNSNHVLARAIIDKATSENITIPKSKHVKEVAGRGLIGAHKGRAVLVGRLEFMKDEAVTMPARLVGKNDTTSTYVAIGGELAGIINFEDNVRPESRATLQALRKLGIQHTLMVTGDNQAAAQKIAHALGIETVVSEALPADKLIAVEKIKQRPVAFVGDGVNDAPVLTAADVGIALGARGSTAASESADMVIMLDSVSYVARAVGIAKHTFQIARQSILVGIALSIILMFVFATGQFKPIYGAFIQEVVDVIVIFNALRAHSYREESL